MYATFFIKFPDANSLSTCLYYLDPDSTLPFSDEVDTDTAELIEWAEELTTLDYSDTSSQDAAYVGFTLSDSDWEYELDQLVDFFAHFSVERVFVYFDDQEEQILVKEATPQGWQIRYSYGEDPQLDDELSAFPDTAEGWHQGLAHVLAKFS